MTDLTQIPIAELIKSGLLTAAMEQYNTTIQMNYDNKLTHTPESVTK
jgi:hypothetical protein